MAADSPWTLRLDLLCTTALVWLARLGRYADAELTREAHLFFFDRYQRLASFHKRQGNRAACDRLQAKAAGHYRASCAFESPDDAAIRPR